jgi:hypothetical protein
LGPELGEALGLEAVQHHHDPHRHLLVVLVGWRHGDPCTFLQRSGRAREVVVGGQALHQLGEVGAGELPLEGRGRLLVAALEGEQPLLDGSKAGEVVGGQEFPLDHREYELDLVQPRGVDGGVDQVRRGQSWARRLTEAMPRCELPLSTTQNTCRAEAYGSLAII